MKFAVIVFPGSNCDLDMYHAVKDALAEEAEDAKLAGEADGGDEEDAEGAVGLGAGLGVIAILALMFSPMDGLFILLAFFTAYKVGSGQATGD